MADNKLITIEDVQEKKYYYYTYLVIDLNPHTKEDGSSVRRHHNNMYIKESDGR